MSLTPGGRVPSDRDDPDGTAPPATTLLELLEDGDTRTLLAAIREGPRSARELVDASDCSRPTVYRRLDRLESAGLVETREVLQPDGHHHREYTTAIEEITIDVDIDDGEVVASVTTGLGEH